MEAQQEGFRRRVGREEASGGFLLLDEAPRGAAPGEGDVELEFDGETYPTKVSAIDCLCKGEEKPHTHSHLIVPGRARVRLRAGKTAVLGKRGRGWLLAFR